mgnify:CR=1 FL=1
MHSLYVDHMGSDDSIVNAARISMDKLASMYTPQQNNQLIKFLALGMSSKAFEKDIQSILTGQLSYEEVKDILFEYKNKATHWTPFAHTAVTLRMKAPVPIRTQCFKHKQGLVENEESRRYINSTPELFIPEFRLRPEGSIKQGSAGSHPYNKYWVNRYTEECNHMIQTYEDMIANNIAPEQARFVLPQGCEVNWIWTGNVLAYANFYNKRSDNHAQKEIQELAEQVSNIIAPLYPMSWEALTGVVYEG